MLATARPVTGTAGAGREFSLVLGGPLFQLLRRTRLSDDTLGLVHRRIVAAVLILWAPLVLLSALQGGLAGGPRTPFFHDVGFQLRFLVVVPLLLLDELVVHRRMRPIVEEFRVRRLVPENEAAGFDRAVAEAARARNSIVVELALLALVYAVGVPFTLGRYIELGDCCWYAAPPSGAGLSLAGLWLVFVSLPLLQFLLLRWYYRLFIWARFLWRVSRLDLDLEATHPDKAGGLGFLTESLNAFIPIAAAHGTLVAGMIADRILFTGASLPQFQLEVLSGAVLLVIVFAGPLAIFAPQLAYVKRTGLREYGALGQIYVRDFRRKWLEGGAPVDEPLVGSGDIQSLADLGNSFASAEQMRLAPIKALSLVLFVAAFLAPIAPLLLTMMPLERLLEQLIGILV